MVSLDFHLVQPKFLELPFQPEFGLVLNSQCTQDLAVSAFDVLLPVVQVRVCKLRCHPSL